MTEPARTRDPRWPAAAIVMKRLAIVASLALNVGFLSGVLARSSSPVEAPEALSSSKHQVLVNAPDGYAGYGKYYAALQSCGLSDADAKTLMLARLEAQARERAIELTPVYWQHDAGSALESALRFPAELDHARAALVEIFGVAAERDPAFTRLFRPLDPSLSFLSSAQQVAIQKLKLEQQAKLLATAAPSVPIAAPLAPVPSSLAPVNDLADQLAALLEQPILNEYLLRDSALADQLRRSRVDFTEPEFRETFAVLQRLEESEPDRDVYANARDSLRALLGGRRFAALWAGRDPLFAAVQRAAERHSLKEETVESVYELFNDHQDNALEAARSANGDRQRQSEGMREAQARLESRLSGLVGAEVAADIQRSYAQQAMALSRQLIQQ
jgi:hypothetical protein